MNKRIMCAVVILCIISATAGFVASTYVYRPTINDFIIEKGPYEITTDFIPVNVTMDYTSIMYTNGCRQISFNVTEDQAYSIAKGLEKSLSERPLTHDIFKDVLDYFEVELITGGIDRYENEIYYAKMYLRQGNKVLVLDTRPSDATAMMLRMGLPMNVNKSIMENAAQVC
jgi:bifunctional DNase/RNase